MDQHTVFASQPNGHRHDEEEKKEPEWKNGLNVEHADKKGKTKSDYKSYLSDAPILVWSEFRTT